MTARTVLYGVIVAVLLVLAVFPVAWELARRSDEPTTDCGGDES